MAAEDETRIEPILWGLFVAGGMIALLIPIQILLVNIATALGLIQPQTFDYDHMLNLVRNPITKLYLLVLICGPLIHGMHRFRHTLYEWGLKGWGELVGVFCYGAALSGCGLAAYVLLTLH